ncbi:bifunctional hydroxy-methylpyrimidine kinase/ hydroxy-phosphomethylpyrimidine kinase [Mycolicibacterium mageritense DSM 44476 = CIP 104973]|uniref:pyridoxal kinase n=1 Tax=Mycolicibacterium mageritense TaxID=53462 RepID=A0AAI8TV41_MYCME|nr:bifunctional hydroxymethylpyrimidine kinase/phosphomethylpyrimidine kinase [Mycolicibacterium mageritense]OKH80610.1 phosphomethylpyrimidine kinase [Mycobacterium sp. SWH-M3]TXH17146.1 MAG: bifunctional hydroxymethylpyrimidine kinase/phosphomethylpyrimidine kinase [Mycobacterium sp.]MCC9180621.1 bifunctional hydroxymethylpyrimidine kinase/phosphomethylpyrimidine kinase [Mycolicibacterium mageritense]CDO23086.1 phosphomethylpyrimidine kinase [Mycolicibacterium mageritense DSM 44476 = CIP 1049
MVDLAYVIAGSEATGGAGLQADLRTFQQLGTYGVGTVTCIVSFDPKANWAHRFVPVEPQVVADQIEAATSAYDLDVVKIGMLGTPATIDVVAQALARQSWRHVVVDPVLICKGQEPGAALDTDTALRQQILPLATVTTPNLFEARTLAGMEEISSVDDLVEAAGRIAELGPRYVVVKGGVEFPGDDAVDVVFDGNDAAILRAPKVGHARVAGAGCTLAAAITAALAKGADVADAVRLAKEFTTAGIIDRVSGHTPFDAVWQGAQVSSVDT